MYAVELQINFVQFLAARIAIPSDSCLHICSHNPMMDPYLTQLYQNFQKGVDRDNFVVIILPPLEKFNASLLSHGVSRARTAKCTKFVSTVSDFEMLLLEMNALFREKILYIFPVVSGNFATHRETPYEVWQSSQKILLDTNCFLGVNDDSGSR